MKICLIGQNLTNLILANVFEEKKLDVDIYLSKQFQNLKTRKPENIRFASFPRHCLGCLLYTSDAADD